MKSTTKQKIDVLENLGYKVHIKHFRNYDNSNWYAEKEQRPLARGGQTQAIIKNGDDLIAQAWSHCNEEDNYNKKIGANIALGRAMARIKINES